MDSPTASGRRRRPPRRERTAQSRQICLEGARPRARRETEQADGAVARAYARDPIAKATCTDQEAIAPGSSRGGAAAGD